MAGLCRVFVDRAATRDTLASAWSQNGDAEIGADLLFRQGLRRGPLTFFGQILQSAFIVGGCDF